MHVSPEMEDYKQLLQSISTLQSSRLGYIELLQEEVKRNQDVSDQLLIQEKLAHAMQCVCVCLDWFLDNISVKDYIKEGACVKEHKREQIRIPAMLGIILQF